MNLGKSDFPCETLQLDDLAENFSPELKIIRFAQYDELGDLISPIMYEKPQENITKIEIKCNRGQIANLIDIGVSQMDSQCINLGTDMIVKV